MKKAALSGVMALLCFYFSNAQTGNIKPLATGDIMPGDLVFTNVYNYPVNKIKFSDLKSKLVILDFWATWCSSCIIQFPKINKLSDVFKDKVQFLLVPHGNTIADSIKVVQFFAKHNATYQLPSLTRDSQLLKLFPHQSIPHYVWISNGKVVAITDAGAINAQNISNALNDLPMNAREKNDKFYDADNFLASYIDTSTSQSLKASFTLTTYLDGFSSPSGHSAKNGMIKYYAINSTLLSLYSLAFPELSYLPANRVIWKVKSVDDYSFPANAEWDIWKLTHTYCFEFIALRQMANSIPLMMKKTLDNYFNVTTGFEEREMPCLVLTANKRFKSISRAQKQLINTLEDRGVTRQLYGGSQELCSYLDTQLLLPVVNNIPLELLDITLPDKPITIENLKEWLMPYGLELIPSTKNIRVFSITDTRF